MPELHKNYIEKIQEEFADWKSGRRLHKDLPSEHPSNIMRKKNYKNRSPVLSTGKLDRILEIDSARKTAWIEPNVSMEKLLHATLPFGLMPPVVPEFKGITVGGAINGAALESSAHLFGQFNDIFSDYEVLLGDGSIACVNKESQRELFYAIAGSYGSLGILLSAKCSLISTTPFLLLTYHKFHKYADALLYLSKKHHEDSPPQYLEAIIYNHDLTVVIEGNHTFEERKGVPHFSLEEFWSPWFYQHACQAEQEEILAVADYIFRHDRGAFWMGGYALHPRMSLSYFAQKTALFFGIPNAAISYKFLPAHCTPKHPGKLFRALFGWIMGSRNLYASLHGGSESWFEENFVIQDFYLPGENSLAFIDYVLERYRIVPLWICPIKSTISPQIFSPHLSDKEQLLFDIGIYGHPLHAKGPKASCDLEEKALLAKGRKMFYGHSYFTEEQFWKIYPKEAYRDLRTRYQFNDIFPDITEKVLK